MEGNLNNPYAAPDAVLSTSTGEDTLYYPRIFALNGRIGRLRYLGYSWLYALIVFIPVVLLQVIIKPEGFISTTLVYAPFYATAFVAARRRMQDLDNSAWMTILILIPIVNGLFGLYLTFAPGTAGENSYGPEPAPNSRGLRLVATVIPLILVIGILAAIAIPAYQQYTIRAKAAAAANQHP
jgi:uncharacterized membrane protein YhaH (DUF805 family)